MGLNSKSKIQNSKMNFEFLISLRSFLSVCLNLLVLFEE